MRTLFFVILLLTCTGALCQSFTDIDNLFKQKKYNETLAACNTYLKTDTTNALVYDEIGRCYNAMHQYSNAIPYFEKATGMDKGATYLTGWAYCDMGLARIKTGDTTKGRADLYKTVELGQTRNSVNTALTILRELAKGQDLISVNTDVGVNTMPDWVVIEAAHIKYFFEDTVGITYLVQHFVAKHEQAFDKLYKCGYLRPPRYVQDSVAPARVLSSGKSFMLLNSVFFFIAIFFSPLRVWRTNEWHSSIYNTGNAILLVFPTPCS